MEGVVEDVKGKDKDNYEEDNELVSQEKNREDDVGICEEVLGVNRVRMEEVRADEARRTDEENLLGEVGTSGGKATMEAVDTQGMEEKEMTMFDMMTRMMRDLQDFLAEQREVRAE
ncbi:hypothetical protein ACLOJK_009797 [Asimina triloba]